MVPGGQNKRREPYEKEIGIVFDPRIPLLGIYAKNAGAQFQKDICTPMFIAALFTVAKIRKQPKCPSVDKWIRCGTCTQWNIIQP